MTVEHVPSEEWRRQVETASGYGLPHEQIAVLVGIDDKTLRKHYRKELDQGMAKANAQVVKSLFGKCTSGDDTTAMIWWTKTRLGWKDLSRVEHVGSEGGPIQINSIMRTIVDPHD